MRQKKQRADSRVLLNLQISPKAFGKLCRYLQGRQTRGIEMENMLEIYDGPNWTVEELANFANTEGDDPIDFYPANTP